ncbi:MAG: ADP-ribosylglycohydrolase family protein [Propionibacteriaceae bacterium]|jgi:ADP-ribosylglycohydrolase|nr:ADP-ribosylglycohydrolase family protein [Propionibacteriaceae bacterium]
MIGAIVGDIVGSPFEFDRGNKTSEFELFSPEADFTDDTLMTLAVGRALMDVAGDESLADEALVRRMREFANRYDLPKGGFGGRFRVWLRSPDPHPYGSYGNGSAMRVSSVGWLFDTLEETEHWAEISARVTHNHPEGIKGAQATAAAIFLARTQGASEAAKAGLKAYIQQRFDYDLTRTLDDIRPSYRHVESCQQSVPEAITAYLESSDFENALRLVISLGGDTDTTGAITGSIAEAAYGIPASIQTEAFKRLPDDLLGVVASFNAKLGRPAIPR